MKFSIVIPAKNEESRISKTLIDLCLFFYAKGFKDLFEVIVVVNDSSDKTLEIVKDLSSDFTEIIGINAPFYTGKGGAITIGFQVARGGIVGFTDADGSSKPAEIFKVLTALSKDKRVDGIIADRYMQGAVINGRQSKIRKVFGSLYRKIVGVLFKIDVIDTQCGLKAFRKHIVKHFAENISTIGWTFDVNLLLLSKFFGYKIKAVPTIWSDVSGSKLKVIPTIFSVSKELILLKEIDLLINFNKIRNGSVSIPNWLKKEL